MPRPARRFMEGRVDLVKLWVGERETESTDIFLLLRVSWNVAALTEEEILELADISIKKIC